jgi:hypothetical protein
VTTCASPCARRELPDRIARTGSSAARRGSYTLTMRYP